MSVKIAVTGSAGQIGYALLFRIVSGALPGEAVSLSLLEVTAALPALDGVEMELRDGAYPLLTDIAKSDDAHTAFADADIIFLVGARPRAAGMERKDLLEANAAIFSAQGKAINAVAKKSVRVLVVGNPANTNCLIAQQNAPDIPPSAFTAMTRLDHNRTLAQLAQKSGAAVGDISRAFIWGNHSSTQYPDIHHAVIGGKPALEVVDEKWYRDEMIPAVQQRGAAIIKARGASSAASAASAAIDHIRDWVGGQQNESDYLSMGVVGGGEYGIAPGLVFSYPVQCKNGDATVVDGLDINDFGRAKLAATEKELTEERDAVRHLLP